MLGAKALRVAMGATIPIGAVFKEHLGADTIFFSFSTSDEDYHAPNEFFRLENFRIGQIAWARLFATAGGTAALILLAGPIANASNNDVTRILWEAIARHVLIIFSRHEYRDDDLNAVTRQHEAFRDKIRDLIRVGGNTDELQAGLEDHLLQVSRATLAPVGSFRKPLKVQHGM